MWMVGERIVIQSFAGWNDSKQLDERQREKFFDAITSHPEILPCHRGD